MYAGIRVCSVDIGQRIQSKSCSCVSPQTQGPRVSGQLASANLSCRLHELPEEVSLHHIVSVQNNMCSQFAIVCLVSALSWYCTLCISEE